jgi:UDP-glucose 4-epimerase
MGSSQRPNVLITGASGLVGTKVLRAIGKRREAFGTIVALDVRPPPGEGRIDDADYVTGDIRDPVIGGLLKSRNIDTVVHLAAIVAPGKNSSPELEYQVDVLGTENILKACSEHAIVQFVYLSSGAAYGYHADNPVPLRETDALRGNDSFAYSKHKRLAEEMLVRFRRLAPGMKQLIFRPGTILGTGARSPVSAIFEGRFVIGIIGADSPFVMIWDEDVAGAIVKGVLECREGIYNLAGDGALTLHEIARRAGKPYLPLPAGLVKAVLWVLKRAGLSARGPEGVNFLRYRPVLANDRLKGEFGYVPEKTSAEVFAYYLGAMR